MPLLSTSATPTPAFSSIPWNVGEAQRHKSISALVAPVLAVGAGVWRAAAHVPMPRGPKRRFSQVFRALFVRQFLRVIEERNSLAVQLARSNIFLFRRGEIRTSMPTLETIFSFLSSSVDLPDRTSPMDNL